MIRKTAEEANYYKPFLRILKDGRAAHRENIKFPREKKLPTPKLSFYMT